MVLNSVVEKISPRKKLALVLPKKANSKPQRVKLFSSNFNIFQNKSQDIAGIQKYSAPNMVNVMISVIQSTSTMHAKTHESEVAESCLTLCDPVDCNLPGSSAHGNLQVRILEGVAISLFRGSS